jgi:plastocyanin domain-containing protein
MSRKTMLSLALACTLLVAGGLSIGKGVVLGKNSPPATQIIQLQAKAGKFNEVNPTLEIRRGVPVEITIRNDEPEAVLHDFVLVGLGLKTPKALQPGEVSTLRFTPSQTGEFAYTCTLHPGLMDGRLIVRP